MSPALIAYLVLQLTYSANRDEITLQSAAEHCMEKLLVESEDLPKKSKKQAFFVQAGASHGAIRTFLAEAILTASVDGVPFVVGLGGSIDSQSLAEGLRLALETVSNIDASGVGESGKVLVVYFTTENDIRYFERVSAEYEVRVIQRIADMGTLEGVMNADCGFRE